MTMTHTKKLVSGVTRGALPWWVLGKGGNEKTLLIVPEDGDVWDVAQEIDSLFKLPSEWNIPTKFSTASYTSEDESTRSRALYEWLFLKSSSLIASRESLSLSCDSPEALSKKTLRLK